MITVLVKSKELKPVHYLRNVWVPPICASNFYEICHWASCKDRVCPYIAFFLKSSPVFGVSSVFDDKHWVRWVWDIDRLELVWRALQVFITVHVLDMLHSCIVFVINSPYWDSDPYRAIIEVKVVVCNESDVNWVALDLSDFRPIGDDVCIGNLADFHHVERRR